MKPFQKLIFAVVSILASLVANSQASTTVTAKLGDVTGSVDRVAFLRFELENCGQNFPVSTAGPLTIVRTRFDLRPNQPDGSGVTTIVNNDEILCGNVKSTWYQVTPYRDTVTPAGPSQPFIIAGTTWNPWNAMPMTVPPPSPGFQVIFGNPTKSQTVTQPSGTKFSFIGSLDLSGATIIGLSTDATKIKGVTVDDTGIADGKSLTYDVATGTIKYKLPTVSGNLGQDIEFGGDISPTQITADQNDYNPASLATASGLRLTSDATRTITGLAGGIDGRIMTVHNVGTQNIVLANQSASSTAANRFAIDVDITLPPNRSLFLWYDATSARWRELSRPASNIGAGHTIQGNGTPFTQRGNLNFSSQFAVTDDAGNDRTNVSVQALAESVVTGLVTDLAGKSAVGHTHAGTDITSGQVGSARGGTGADSSAQTGIPRVTAGVWTWDAAIAHLKSSTSADLRGVLSDEIGTGPLLFASAIQNQSATCANSATGNDTYAITVTPAPSGYAALQKFCFKADVANVGAASLNVNGLGNVPIKVRTNVDPADNDIKAGTVVYVSYDGTNFQMVNQPATSSAGFSGTTPLDFADALAYLISGENISTPGVLPSTGHQKAYFKSGFGLCALDESNVERCTGSSAGGNVIGSLLTNGDIILGAGGSNIQPSGVQLSTLATLASPAFTGLPTAPTAALNTSTAQIASTQFVMNQLAATSNGFGNITSGNNNDATMTVDSGASIVHSGTGQIDATHINGLSILALSGDTTTVATTSGSFTTDHCIKVDANGNLVDAGDVCGSGGSGATPGGTPGDLQVNASPNFGGTAGLLTWATDTLTFGIAATTTGKAAFANGGVGGASITLQNNAATAAYNFNLPASAGSSGQPLLSGGGGATPMSFGTLGIAAGGTGQTTAAAAFNALSCLTTAGDLLYGGTAGACTRLAAGTNSQVLIGGTIPSWGAINLASAMVSGILPAANGGSNNAFFQVTGPATSVKTFTLPNASAVILTDNTLVTAAQGGTGNGFFQVSGPSGSTKTYTFPNANTTVLTTNAAVTVAQGGTGLATLTLHGVLLGQGTSNVVSPALGTAGQCFTSNGAGADPSFQACGGSIAGLTAGYIPKAATATSVTNSELDIGVTLPNTLTVSLDGGIQTTNSTGAAGIVLIGQGTAQGTTSQKIGITAPTAVTAYDLVLPGAAGSGFLKWANVANIVTASFVANIDLTTDVGSTILPGANGGTGNAFFAVTGPTTSLKTFTFPNASATVLTSNAAVTVPQGGTGVGTFTNHGVLLGQSTSAIVATTAGLSGQCFLSNGASADPSFQACPSAGGGALSALSAAVGANSINNGDNAQVWNWQLTTSGKSAFTFGENTAGTAAGTPYLVNIQTLATSTVNPLVVTAVGTANGIQVLKSGFLTTKGTGGIDSNMLHCDVTDGTKCIKYVISGITTATTRNWTFPDAADTFVGLTATQTLTNKTLTSPTIGDFTNAQHDHHNAGAGGQITDAALSAAVGVSKGGTGLTGGTSGGTPYFDSASTMASSALLAANSLVLGGGAGAAPKTIAGIFTDGTSKLTLGQAGTSVGQNCFANATSGTICLQPTTGALGTVTITLPARTATLGTTTGTLTSGNGVKFDASGNLIDGGWVAANTVVASSPGAGVAHFAGSTQTVTSSAVVNGDLGANAVDSAKMAVVNTRRVCDIAVGDASGSVLTNGQLGPQKRICYIPAASTIVEMDVAADGGTPNVIVGVNHAGSVSNIVSAALATAASGGIACSKTSGVAGIDGATTCSATLQNTSMAAGDYLELVSGTAGGTAKLMTVHVIYTVN